MKGKDRNIVILGAGESGVGASALAIQRGYPVFVSDAGKIRQSFKDELLQLDCEFEEGGHTISRILSAAEIIKSPGIPESVPLMKQIRERGIPVISEIEFAGRFCKGRTVCITGSNGKTTTTLLTGHILKKAGLDVVVAGNVGNSFARSLCQGDHDYYVLEVSSFQLDDLFDFRADIAILLNITPDHLDRYDYQFEKYTASKFRIIRNQKADDSFIFCYDDEVIRKEISQRRIVAKPFPFSIHEALNGDGGWLEHPLPPTGYHPSDEKNSLVIEIHKEQFKMTLESLALQGRHNIYNSLAAGIAARVLDLRKSVVKESLSDFQNVEHRLEFVARVHGIDFINDSKATNVNSTWYALESIDKPVIWIAGGIDKGNDYSMLHDLVGQKVKAIVCLGVSNERIKEAFQGIIGTIVETRTAFEAVEIAYRLGRTGDVVLLSPACASFDLFNNYEDRGRQFKEAVMRI